MDPAATQITALLDAAREGDTHARDRAVDAIYETLVRIATARLAHDRVGRALEPAELVHEAWRWLESGLDHPWKDRGHFFAAAARAMERLVVDQARRRDALKRGGGDEPRTLETRFGGVDAGPDRALEVVDAIAALERVSPRQAEIARLRLFAGRTAAEIAALVGTSPRTVEGDWTMARAWLKERLGG